MAVASTSASASASNGNGTTSTAAPSPTLYIKNIEGKVKKPELRRQLHTLFSAYGRVLDVVATRAPSMRGQAFVVYADAATAGAARRALSGFAFYGKPLHVDFSTGAKSKALLRRELGTDAVREMDLERSKTGVSRRAVEKRPLVGEQDEALLRAGEEEEGDRKRVKLEGAEVHARSIPASIEPAILTTLFSSRAGFQAISSQGKEGEDTWSATITFDTPANAHAAQAALHGVQLDAAYTLDLHVS